jgi:hypothetical protein
MQIEQFGQPIKLSLRRKKDRAIESANLNEFLELKLLCVFLLSHFVL